MGWLCGDLKIRRNLQGVWKGQCTPINMVMPFKIIKGVAGDIKEELKGVKQLSRTKHAVTSFKGSQIAAGFESLLFWWSTINKNVDWINKLDWTGLLQSTKVRQLHHPSCKRAS